MAEPAPIQPRHFGFTELKARPTTLYWSVRLMLGPQARIAGTMRISLGPAHIITTYMPSTRQASSHTDMIPRRLPRLPAPTLTRSLASPALRGLSHHQVCHSLSLATPTSGESLAIQE